MREIYRGDDTSSFGQVWCKISVDIPSSWETQITAAEFKVGNLPAMWFDNPEFPLSVNLPSDQTEALKDVNICYLALYDSLGKKQTLEGSFSFKTKKRVV